MDKIYMIKEYIEKELYELEHSWEDCYRFFEDEHTGEYVLEPINERMAMMAKELRFAIMELEFILKFINKVERLDERLKEPF